MNLEESLINLDDLENQKADIQKQINEAKQDVVKRFSPVQEGDEAICNGYSFKGKRMIVRHVFLQNLFSGYRFRAKGELLKADGSIGARIGEWFGERIDV